MLVGINMATMSYACPAQRDPGRMQEHVLASGDTWQIISAFGPTTTRDLSVYIVHIIETTIATLVHMFICI